MRPAPDQGLRVRALADQATAAALDSDWARAVELNSKIIEAAPDDVEARNRFGRALLEQGKLEEAKASFAEVLKTEPYNSIALRNQARVVALLEHKSKPNVTTSKAKAMCIDSSRNTQFVPDARPLSRPRERRK